MDQFVVGLVDVGPDVQAYLQPDGGWGLSNAGLIAGDGASLLVDTLYDLATTGAMLAAMGDTVAGNPIATVVNTHANGDHCYGNQLVADDGVDIIASKAAAAEIVAVPPAAMAGLMRADVPPVLRRFLDAAFGRFDFDGIELVPPTTTFTGRMTVDAGGRPVELVEVGPAHTEGDVIVHVPDADVVFTGDVLFNGSTPVMWSGPISSWIAACDLILDLGPRVIVPGHGPIATSADLREAADYLRFVDAGVRLRFRSGMAVADAAHDLDTEVNGTRFGAWGERERLVVTVHHVWAELDPDHKVPSVPELFSTMAANFARRADAGTPA